MLAKGFSAAAVAALASLAAAQTSTDCNPLEKECPADPAFGTTEKCDFTKGKCDLFELADGTTLKYGDKGAVFTVAKGTDAPTIKTKKYIFFGRVDVTMQAAAGAGIVTSAVLESDDLDEVDLEWVGADDKQVQSNYFSKGNTKTYNRGGFHAVSDPTGSFHTYSVEWTSSAVKWLIDDKVVRSVTPDSAKASGNDFPQTPMQIKLGLWCAGNPDSPKGTKEWAGGETDFSKGPFHGYYQSVTITDYAGKDAPAKGGVKEYKYGDHTGTWKSIKVVGGSSDSDSDSSSSNSTETASATGSATGTKTGATTMATSAGSATKTGSDSSSTGSSGSGSGSSSGSSSGSGSGSGNGTASGTAASPSKTAGASRSVIAVGGAILAGAGAAFALL